MTPRTMRLSRANSQVGQALSSQGPESLWSRSTEEDLSGLVLDLLHLLDPIGIGMVTSSRMTLSPTSQGETLYHSP